MGGSGGFPCALPCPDSARGVFPCFNPTLRLHRADVTHRGGQAQSSCLMCASDDRGRSVAQAKYIYLGPRVKDPQLIGARRKKKQTALPEPGFCCLSKTLRGCLPSLVSRPTTQLYMISFIVGPGLSLWGLSIYCTETLDISLCFVLMLHF